MDEYKEGGEEGRKGFTLTKHHTQEGGALFLSGLGPELNFPLGAQ